LTRVSRLVRTTQGPSVGSRTIREEVDAGSESVKVDEVVVQDARVKNGGDSD
jgi:hypothetical protein